MGEYITIEEYREMSASVSDEVSDKELERAIHKANHDIDSMTFNRIRRRGFGSLTAFQQHMIKEAIVLHVEFTAAYDDILNNPLSGYSIDGVSLSFNGDNIHKVSGVTTSAKVNGLLLQTGLTNRGV